MAECLRGQALSWPLVAASPSDGTSKPRHVQVAARPSRGKLPLISLIEPGRAATNQLELPAVPELVVDEEEIRRDDVSVVGRFRAAGSAFSSSAARPRRSIGVPRRKYASNALRYCRLARSVRRKGIAAARRNENHRAFLVRCQTWCGPIIGAGGSAEDKVWRSRAPVRTTNFAKSPYVEAWFGGGKAFPKKRKFR